MAGNRKERAQASAVTFAEKAQLMLHLWAIAALLTVVVKALLS